MALSDPFRFSVKNEAGQWLQWNSGNLVTSSSIVYLTAPGRWKDTETTWTRSIDSRGLIRGTTTPYDFIRATASIMRYYYYNQSVQNHIYYLIEWLNPDTMEYEDFFSGEIDLSTFSDGTIYNGQSIGVGASVIEGGIVAQLEGAGATEYSIPILVSDSDLIYHDGITLRETNNYAPIGLSFTNNTLRGVLLPSAYLNTEGAYTIGIAQGQTLNEFNEASSSLPPSPQFDDFFFRATTQMDCNLSGTLSINVTNRPFNVLNERFFLDFRVFDGANFLTQSFTLYSDPTVITPGGNHTSVFSFSHDFSLNPDDRCFLVAKTLMQQPCDYVITANSSTGFEWFYNLKATYRFGATLVRGYQLWKLIDKLLTAITGLTGILQSDYLTSPNARYQYMNPYNVRMTCGDALRGLTIDAAGTINITPSIRISWQDMMHYLKYAHGCGMDVRDGKVVIERASFFFDQSSIIADVGVVNSLKVEPARDYMFNSFKAGYPVVSYDHLNGKDEINTTCTWTGSFTHFTQEDQTVGIRTDPYGMEELRSNLSGKKTIDTSSDNDTFAIETNGFTSPVFTGGPFATSAYKLYRPQNSFTQPVYTGFLFVETMYNLTMQPILNMFRNGAAIRGMFLNIENQVLKFQSTDKNPVTYVNLGGIVVQSNSDILISDLDTPLWKPSTLIIEAVLPTAFLQAMRNKPSGCIRFMENGITYKGFPLLTGVKSADRNSYNMLLLCTPDTDLLQRAV